jgi:HEPN domain-containing protein
MKSITREWVNKAEGDFATAQREFIARPNPNYDAVCFHSQQCAEKLLKARLQEADIAFIKTHDLPFLLDLVVAVEPGWEALRSALTPLTAYAVEYRYPGETCEQLEAAEALEACRKVRSMVLAAFGLQADVGKILE